jgi:hypothetical protein
MVSTAGYLMRFIASPAFSLTAAPQWTAEASRRQSPASQQSQRVNKPGRGGEREREKRETFEGFQRCGQTKTKAMPRFD